MATTTARPGLGAPAVDILLMNEEKKHFFPIATIPNQADSTS